MLNVISAFQSILLSVILLFNPFQPLDTVCGAPVTVSQHALQLCVTRVTEYVSSGF